MTDLVDRSSLLKDMTQALLDYCHTSVSRAITTESEETDWEARSWCVSYINAVSYPGNGYHWLETIDNYRDDQ